MMKKKVKKQLQVKLIQHISKIYKDGAVTYYPHGLQPNMYSSCAVWSISFHIYVQSNLFVLAMYFDTVSNTNLFLFSFFMLLPNIKDCTSIVPRVCIVSLLINI
jgi:hypothetical protein